MSHTEDARRELLTMSGHDGNALLILDTLFDCALDETDVPISDLRCHCAEPSDKVGFESLGFILVTFPERIRQWVWCESEAEGQRLWKEILAALHVLRQGQLPCGSCLQRQWNCSQTRSAVHGPYCQECWTTLVQIPRGRTELRLVSDVA